MGADFCYNGLMFRFKICLLGLFPAVFLALVQTVAAAEIQYGHVEEVHSSGVHIQYKGPGGQENFSCDLVSFECVAFGTSTPPLYPEIDGRRDYPNSPHGNYGIIEVADEDNEGSFIYTLYDVSGAEAVVKAVLPYTKATNAYKFSWDDQHLVIFGTDGTVSTYVVATGEITEIEPEQSSFPLKSPSPHAKYLAAYNYVAEAHKVWDTKTGAVLSIDSSTPSFVEFSQSERYLAFADDPDGYQTLYLVDLSDGRLEPQRVFRSNFTIEDYLWFKDKLYAVGNTAGDPYRWVLYQYDPATGGKRIIAENVSYGDYIRPVGDYGLSFLVIEGKNSHVALYDAEADAVRVIKLVPDSPASAAIERSVVAFDDGMMGVLYEPEKRVRKPDLFVWLHGGPMRQTSFGYHSYLSYAVYDELLERLVESGAYVLKLDYPGSYGHGSEFKDQLSTQLGRVDVWGVIEAARETKKDYRIDDVYLIGNSYGGYLGPKALVERERLFDGVIAINGVFDWFDLLERIPSSPFKTHFNGLVNLADLQENFALYKEASVVKDLPRLSRLKPMLLIYGADDSTVPVWQTREFFYQAKILGKSVSLLELEGEGHIIRGRESLNTMCQFIADKLLLKDVACE